MTDGPRAPRQALAAERAVLAAMLTDPQAIPRAAACLKASAFFRRAHAKVFESALAMHARGEPVDVVTMAADLESRGELAQAGGPVALASLLESATTSVNLEHHARMVRRAYATRERIRIGEALANGLAADPAACRDLLKTLETLESEAEATTDPAKAWAALALSGSALISADLPATPSWLGDGLLPAGELAILTGHPGTGKTFLALQIASALSVGHTFCGIPTRAARVGLVELEMPWNSIQSRIAKLDTARSDASQLTILCDPGRVLPLRLADSQRHLIELARTHSLDVLILDALNYLHDGDETSGEDVGAMVAGLHTVRREAGCAILVLHHVRKMPAGAQATASRAASLDAVRGHSRLTNDPATVATLDESKGLVRLSWIKTRHCQTPQPIYLRRNDHGYFDVAEDPATGKQRRTDSLRLMLERAGDDGITAALAAEVLKVTERTVRRDLEELGAQMIREGSRGKRWVLPIEGPTPTDEELPL